MKKNDLRVLNATENQSLKSLFKHKCINFGYKRLLWLVACHKSIKIECADCVLVADVTHMPRQISKQSSHFYVVAVVFIGQTFLAI